MILQSWMRARARTRTREAGMLAIRARGDGGVEILEELAWGLERPRDEREGLRRVQRESLGRVDVAWNDGVQIWDLEVAMGDVLERRVRVWKGIKREGLGVLQLVI